MGGYCTLTYNESISLLSRYDIECGFWEDPERLGVGTYTYFYYEVLDNGDVVRSNLASTGLRSIQAILPVGVNDVHVEICDILDSCTIVRLGVVNTSMPTKEDFDQYDAQALIEYYAATGDQVMMAMAIKALNSVLDNAAWTQLDPDSIANMTEAQLNDLLFMLSNTSAQQIKTILNTASPSTLPQINTYMQTLASSVQRVSRAEMASYTIDLETKDDAMAVIDKMTSKLEEIDVPSPEQYVPFLHATLLTMSSITISSNTIIRNNERVPPRDYVAAPEMYYDTALPVDDLEFSVSTDPDQLLTKSVLENTKTQSELNAERMYNTMENVKKTIGKKLVKGETTSAKTEEGAYILLAKLGEEQLVNGLRLKAPPEQNAQVWFPENFCPSKQLNPYSICRTEFFISYTLWNCIPNYHSKTSHYLSFSTRVAESDAYLENEQVDVYNQRDPIIFTIPRLEEPLLEMRYVNTSYIISSSNLVFHYFNVTNPMSAITVEIIPDTPNKNLLILLQYDGFPLPHRYWKSYLVKDLPIINNTYTAFIDSVETENKTGKFVAGVGLLKDGYDMANLNRHDLDSEFSINYKFRIFSSSCYFYNRSTSLWTGDGLSVISTTYFSTECASTHLTAFGTGFFPQPNEINFEFIVANMGLIDNSTLYVVLFILVLLYIIMMIWAHYKDKRDSERRGVVPLPDNDPKNKYIYEITFFTGPDNEASCESNISFILSGDYGETEVRRLPPPNPNLYRRYDRNSFVMTTPGPLGIIRSMRIFHDNMGRLPYDSWQLTRAVVRDLPMGRLYSFDTNCWLALNRDDGELDKTFSCSENNDETTTFSQEMYNRTNQATNQDHMWLSLFLRPIGSRFSRKERVTVCAVFLYTSMMISAMYYQVRAETPVDAYIYLGPIPLSSTYLLNGVLVLLICYPLVLCLTYVFKRARPKNLRRCRALDSIEKQKERQFYGLTDDDSDEEEDEEVEEDFKVDIDENQPPVPKAQPIVKCIPWWTRTLAWIISLVLIVVSLILVTMYGIMWGNIKTIQWFSSFFTCFFISLIITQWIKVLLYSCFGALFTKTRDVSEDIDCDEELPHLKHDEEWGNVKLLDSSTVRKIEKVEGVNDKNVDRLRQRLQKEREMKFVLRGVLIYCLFLIVVLIIVSDRTDVNNYRMKQHLERTFIKPGHKHLDVRKKVNINLIVL